MPALTSDAAQTWSPLGCLNPRLGAAAEMGLNAFRQSVRNWSAYTGPMRDMCSPTRRGGNRNAAGRLRGWRRDTVQLAYW